TIEVRPIVVIGPHSRPVVIAGPVEIWAMIVSRPIGVRTVARSVVVGSRDCRARRHGCRTCGRGGSCSRRARPRTVVAISTAVVAVIVTAIVTMGLMLLVAVTAIAVRLCDRRSGQKDAQRCGHEK